ncbi:hypothetical protein [Neisseria sp. CCUG12390]|uniref:hypothetical protein n=1 Tax=Neisseria sp. CCUG12390 TaxID=3392035 RepID=UPI003A101B88
MKQTVTFSLIAAAILAAGCSDNKPSNSLFEKTINRHAEKQGVCVPLVLNVQNPRSAENFAQTPIGTAEIKLAEKDAQGNEINRTALKQLRILEKEDFYEHTEESIPAAFGSEEKTKVLVYRLTEKGEKQTRVRNKMPHFCIGHQKVNKINWYTEPSPSNGMTVSRVSYEAKFVPEKWIGNLLKAGGNEKLPFDEIRAQTATLVKTSDGWKDIRELR